MADAPSKPLDIDYFRTWIGKQESADDTIQPFQIAALAATLDHDGKRPWNGEEIPPLSHWMFCLPTYRQSDLAEDGHARKGGFLPPVPLERRMWAGSRFEFLRPLHVGDNIRRTSTIADVTLKEGRTGPLVFATVKHEIAGPSGVAILEEHDIVYRDAPKPGEQGPEPRKARTDAAWKREIVPTDALLFRYSALTFNSHRIHYDRRYVKEVEGYPGLIVHGPLIATLLTDLLGRNSKARLTKFKFRAMKPLFDTAPFLVCGKPDGKKVALWAQDAEGYVTTDAEAEISVS